MAPDDLKAKLAAAFPGADVNVVDLTGTKDHYEARIVAAVFSGKNRIERHRLVHQALGALVGGEIHALKLQLLSPEERK